MEENITFSKLESVYAFLVLALGFCFVRFTLWNIPGLFTTIFFWGTALACLWYLKKNNYKLGTHNRILFGLILLFSLVFTITANHFIKFLDVLFTLTLGIYWVYSVCSETRGFGRFFFFAMLKAVLVMPFSRYAIAVKAMSHSNSQSTLSKNIKLVLGGFVLAIPVTLIVTLILTNADSGVEKMLNTIFNFSFPDFSLLIIQLTIGMPVAFYIFGMLYSNARKENKDILSEDRCENIIQHLKTFPNIVMYSSVTPVCILYILFFVSQLQYFISAFCGMLPHSYSYSAYARRGFFELSVIAVINLLILLAINYLSKETDKNKPFMLKAYTIMISVFTLLIIATALSKMFMYIGMYGLTPLRMYTSWFMTLLAILFLIIIIKQFRIQLHSVKYIVVIFIAWFGILCFSNVDGIVAKYNIARYQSGQIKNFDVNALCTLSDDGLIYVIKSGIDTKHFLDYHMNKYSSNSYSVYNLSSFRVKQLLEKK